MDNKNNNRLVLSSILGIISLILITLGVTYAVFTYIKEGTTDNVVTSGTLKFLYTENSAGGTGINISEAEPMSDTQGKSLVGDNNVFDFKVEATNTGSEVIPYEVTLRKKDISTMSEDNVKVYLTDETESTDIVEPTLYSKLTQTNIDVGSNIEKTLYKGEVAASTNNYLKTFRLRMWIDGNSNQDDINGKSFTGMVNVYSNAKVTVNTNVTLKDEIMKNPIVEANPTLTKNILSSGDASGLYSSTATNTGAATYYFRGAVENNYVSFAGQTWRIVRVNEDGTIRMIMQDGINDNKLNYYNTKGTLGEYYKTMYYTNSEAKTTLDTWYNTNIGVNEEYSKYVVTGNYYCEQAKTRTNAIYGFENATMPLYSDYTAEFKCQTDGNGYGLVNANIGLITYDEVVYAGGYAHVSIENTYLYGGTTNSNQWFTMSPAGTANEDAVIWVLISGKFLGDTSVKYGPCILRPVINLKANTIVTGTGTADNPYKVQ